jgi:hypothetical protein
VASELRALASNGIASSTNEAPSMVKRQAA